MFAEWLKKIETRYLINIEEHKGDNHFEHSIYYFSDPHKRGVPFSISVNDKGYPSVFNSQVFKFKYFNIAEYVNSRDILTAAEFFLEGKQAIKKSFLGKKRVEFNLSTFHGESQPGSMGNAEPINYTKKS